MRSHVKQLVYTALFTALICVSTMSIRIPVPFTNGYIHPGDSMIFIAATLLNLPFAMFSAGVGSMLADIFSGATSWAVPTLIIKSLMALILSLFIHSNHKKIMYLVTGLATCIWIGFAGILNMVLKKTVTLESRELLQQLEDITTMEQLMEQNAAVQQQLIIFAIAIPLFMLLLLFLINKKNKVKLSINTMIGMMLSGLWMIVGYYFSATIMFGSFITPIFSIPWNIVQFGIGFFIAMLLLPFIKRIYLIYSK